MESNWQKALEHSLLAQKGLRTAPSSPRTTSSPSSSPQPIPTPQNGRRTAPSSPTADTASTQFASSTQKIGKGRRRAPSSPLMEEVKAKVKKSVVPTANPLSPAIQLSSALTSLQEATAAAQICQSSCSDLVSTAVYQAPTLCSLLNVARSHPHSPHLNQALSSLLWSAVHTLHEATDILHNYMNQSFVSRLRGSSMTESFVHEHCSKVGALFAEIPRQATASIRAKKDPQPEAVEEASIIRAVRSDLQCLFLTKIRSSGDRSRARTIAIAAEKRKRDKGQKALETDDITWSVAAAPNGRLYACGVGNALWLCDMLTGGRVRTVPGHYGAVLSAAWSPDGTVVATGSEDRTARLYDLGTASSRHVLEGHHGAINSVAWSVDGNFVITGADDCTARIWRVVSGSTVHILRGHSKAVNSVAWSPIDDTVATASHDNTVVLWNSSTGEQLKTLKDHVGAVNTISWSPDGSMLATGSRDNTIRLWKLATGDVVNTIDAHSDSVKSVSWKPDGSMVASGADDRTLHVWSVATGAHVQQLVGHLKHVVSVAWSPCGKSLLAASCHHTWTDRQRMHAEEHWKPEKEGGMLRVFRMPGSVSKQIEGLVGADTPKSSSRWHGAMTKVELHNTKQLAGKGKAAAMTCPISVS